MQKISTAVYIGIPLYVCFVFALGVFCMVLRLLTENAYMAQYR